MRAGAFADKRVIDLINRRFVPFFFNTSGPGQGKDKAAEDFVRGKTQNQWAYLAAFHPDGRYIDEPEIYADEDDVYRWLLTQLDRFSEYASLSAEEQLLLTAAEAPDATARDRLDGAIVAAEIGRTELAERLLEFSARGDLAEESAIARARLLRLRGDWKRHADALAALPPMDRAIEQGYGLLAAERWSEAKGVLEAAVRGFPDHIRHAEARCYAGKACFFLDQRDRAKYHWMWVVENRPEDRFFMRCKIAAAADQMPYPNSLLNGYEAPVGMIGPHNIEQAVRDARRIHLRYAPVFEQGLDDDALDVQPEWASGPTGALVRRLRDGNEHVLDNNQVIDALLGRGPDAVEPLFRAAQDETFAGRGYAIFALARVFEATAERPREVLELIDRSVEDADAYVRMLARSGRMRLARADASSAADAGVASDSQRAAMPAGDLVRQLRDGNAHLPVNNRIVSDLQVLGYDAIEALIEAIRDHEFTGRGYAAWALGVVLASCGEDHTVAERVLSSCADDPDDYVRVLADSGSRVFHASRQPFLDDASLAEIDSPSLLIAAMVDGFAHDARTAAAAGRLVHIGASALPALKAAIADPAFPGPVAAIGAAAEILMAHRVEDAEVIRLIRAASRRGGEPSSAAEYALRQLDQGREY